MTQLQPKQKGFFAKYWGLLLAGGLVLGLIVLAGLGVGAYFLLRGNPDVTSITVQGDKPVYGDTLTVKALVENKGTLDADFHAVLLVDDSEAATQDITLKSKEPQTLTFNVSGLSAGKHKAKINDAIVEFTIYKPANLELTDFTAEPASMMVGETVKVKAKVKNSGELDGQYEGSVMFDSTELQAFADTVGPGEEKEFEAEFTITSRGSHAISLEGKSVPLTVLAPASIEATGMKLSKSFVKPREAATATVTVENSGDLPGQYTVSLLVNGRAAQKKDVTVEGNSSVDVAFRVLQAKAGRYALKVGDYSATLKVVVITRPKTGTLLVKKANGGRCTVTLVNGYKNQDALFVLASTSNPKAPLLTVYVRAGQKTSKIKVKDGNYYVYYSTGLNFDSASKTFCKGPSYGRFDDPVPFKTTKSYSYYYTTTSWNNWTISIGVSGGNSPVTDLNEGGFPK